MDKKGFTLIELLVVIAIIAVLVLIVIVAINPAEQIRKSYDRRWEALLNQTMTGVHDCVVSELSKSGANASVIINSGVGSCTNVAGGILKPTYIANNVDLSLIDWGATVGADICGSINSGAHGGHNGITSFKLSSGTLLPVGSGAAATSPCP